MYFLVIMSTTKRRGRKRKAAAALDDLIDGSLEHKKLGSDESTTTISAPDVCDFSTSTDGNPNDKPSKAEYV